MRPALLSCAAPVRHRTPSSSAAAARCPAGPATGAGLPRATVP